LFVTQSGKAFSPEEISQVARRYLRLALPDKEGAAHIFRHTMATLMLDNGADIRYVQEMLGHVKLATTQVYTHVAIGKLQEIHRATHPAESTHQEEPSRQAQGQAQEN
jgi:integrase/recombinase XerD